jgi:hypothetical protein
MSPTKLRLTGIPDYGRRRCGLTQGIVVIVKAKFDDHVITVRSVTAPDGTVLPPGTHGSVIEAFSATHEHYEVEFDRDDGDQILMVVGPDDFGVA